MVEDASRDLCFIIDVIVSDNDKKILAVLKEPLIGSQGQVLNSPKGKIDE